MAKMLIISGAFLILIGLIMHFGGNFFHLGSLPGDIKINSGGFSFYFPVVTCILLSVIISLLLKVFS